ncbi:hypothetical protein PO909_024017 [Leuciscus waleckii]
MPPASHWWALPCLEAKMAMGPGAAVIHRHRAHLSSSRTRAFAGCFEEADSILSGRPLARGEVVVCTLIGAHHYGYVCMLPVKETSARTSACHPIRADSWPIRLTRPTHLRVKQHLLFIPWPYCRCSRPNFCSPWMAASRMLTSSRTWRSDGPRAYGNWPPRQAVDGAWQEASGSEEKRREKVSAPSLAIPSLHLDRSVKRRREFKGAPPPRAMFCIVSPVFLQLTNAMFV